MLECTRIYKNWKGLMKEKEAQFRIIEIITLKFLLTGFGSHIGNIMRSDNPGGRLEEKIRIGRKP